MVIRLLHVFRQFAKRLGRVLSEGHAPRETQLLIRAFYYPVDESGYQDKYACRRVCRAFGKAIDAALRFLRVLPIAGLLPGATARPGPAVRTGKLEVYLKTRDVRVGGKPLHLTAKEYALLELLTLRKGTVLTKEMLLDHLFGEGDQPELKIVDVFVCKLRKKLAAATGGEPCIATVKGHGYVLRDPTDALM